MKENVIYGVSALQALWLVLPLQRKSLNPLSTRTLLSFKYIHSRIVFMFAWWGQRAKICWTSSLHAHVCLSLSLSWRVLPCPNIRLGAGLDAGNSAVRLSCIALPTLSCHVTVFALHLPLPVSVTSPLALPQAARPSAIHGNNFILLPLVGSRRVETCKSSASVMHTACPLGKILRLLSTLQAHKNVDDAFTIVESTGNCAKACTKNRAE